MDHECFELLVSETGYDATFEKVISFDFVERVSREEWMLRLRKYTPAGNISKAQVGNLKMSYCPLCGRDLLAGEE